MDLLNQNKATMSPNTQIGLEYFFSYISGKKYVYYFFPSFSDIGVQN